MVHEIDKALSFEFTRGLLISSYILDDSVMCVYIPYIRLLSFSVTHSVAGGYAGGNIISPTKISRMQ